VQQLRAPDDPGRGPVTPLIAPLQKLASIPIGGVDMGSVHVLRLDLTGDVAPGNKWFKLQRYLAFARARGVRRLVSFGGPWSNHLHALAAVGRQEGFETIGIVRGETSTAMLEDAAVWGMHIQTVTREAYRRRNDPAWLAEVTSRFDPCLVIPEGGAGPEGARGCLAIGRMVREQVPPPARVVLAVGTGTTLAGVAAGLGGGYQVTGVAALKGAAGLEQRVAEVLAESRLPDPALWKILHDCHCGGFARTDAGLRAFMTEFESIQGIPLEPVYTAKALYAVHRQLQSGRWRDELPLVVIHTGGLQGRRGYGWLTPGAMRDPRGAGALNRR